VRQYFDIQTPNLNRFDIHVTTLNPGFKSHDPHTHKNEEIILMLDGNGEMQIGETHQKSNAGDVVFLNSMVLHNITNIGTIPCMYFAIQWN
jgi:(S)-ureidoglycine aminohydrolase